MLSLVDIMRWCKQFFYYRKNMTKPFDLGLSASEQFLYIRYSYFSWEHVLVIIISAIVLILVAVLFRRQKHLINIVLIVSSVLVAMCMVGLVAYTIITKQYNLEWYLPFHICNLFLFALPLSAIFKNKVRIFLKDYIVLCGLGGSILNIMFPLSSMLYYPVFHITSVLVWVHHLTIGGVSVYMLTSGNYKKVNAFNFLSVLTGLLILAPIVNSKTDANFLFINPKREVPPLSQINDFFAPLGVWAVIIMVYIIAVVLHFVTNKKPKNKKDIT